MKNVKLKLSLVLAAGILTLFACKKETQTIDPIISPTVPNTELTNFFETNKSNLIQNFTIDATSPSLITGNKGTTIQFFANSFETIGGSAVTGNVDIEFIEIFDKSDMILADVTTLGQDAWGGSPDPLISGGEFYVTATQGGATLKLKQYSSYQVNVPAPGGVNPSMDLFYGSTSNDTMIWNQADSGRIGGTGSTYNCFFDSLNWINCDYFYSNPNVKTNVRAIIPAGFTSATCKVFISFNGLNAVTSFYGFSGGYLNTFSPYKLPVTLNVNLVAVAVIGGVPQYSITPATISNNIIVTINPLTASTTASIAAAINALP